MQRLLDNLTPHDRGVLQSLSRGETGHALIGTPEEPGLLSRSAKQISDRVMQSDEDRARERGAVCVLQELMELIQSDTPAKGKVPAEPRIWTGVKDDGSDRGA